MESLKKILPSDKFPCFSCFDHPKDKLNCKECHGNGWIPGSHPIVQFAEDFLEKRLGGMVTSEMANSSGPESDFGDCMVKMSGSDDPYRRSKDAFPNSSVRTVNLRD